MRPKKKNFELKFRFSALKAYIPKNSILKYTQKDGHLTDEGIALYVEALQLNRLEQLPREVKEHMASCEICMQQAIELYALMENIDEAVLGKHPSLNKEKKSPRKRYIRLGLVSAAATLALLLYWFSLEETALGPAPEAIRPAIKDTLNLPQEVPQQVPQALEEETPIQKTVPKPAPLPKEPEQYAYNFEPSEELEELTGAITRSNLIKIDKPQLDATLKVGQIISFAWQQSEQVPFFLIVLTNNEEILLRTEVSSGTYDYKEKLPPGLYYWKLETEDDLVHVGKFFIR